MGLLQTALVLFLSSFRQCKSFGWSIESFTLKIVTDMSALIDRFLFVLCLSCGFFSSSFFSLLCLLPWSVSPAVAVKLVWGAEFHYLLLVYKAFNFSMESEWGESFWIFLFADSTLSSEKEMATHSSIIAWRIPWSEKPDGLQSIGSQRVGHDWSNLTFMCALSLL